MVIRVPVLLFCFSSVSSRPLGGGEVVRGRGRALPPNLLASHNYRKALLPQNLLTASHKGIQPKNLLFSQNGHLSDKELISQNQPSQKTYFGVKKDPSQNSHYFYDSQSDDKEHFPANPLLNKKPHKKKNENFPSNKFELDEAEDSFSLELPDFFEQHSEPSAAAMSSRFQWSPIKIVEAPRRRLINRRAGWEAEKKSWFEADAESPPFGDILQERFGRPEVEKRSGNLGGWKPLSEDWWATTPDIWTNEVESPPVITIDNYKKFLNIGIGNVNQKKNFEKVVRGSIKVSGDSPSHLIINRP